MAGRIVLSDNFVSRTMRLLSMYLFGNSETVHLDDRPAHLTKECDVIVMSNYVWSPDVGVRPTSGWNRRVE
jgi:hypothetical protein